MGFLFVSPQYRRCGGRFVGIMRRMQNSSDSGPGPDLCTEAEVTVLVHDFYARVRKDAALGPIFEAHVHDWPAHLSQLVDFWSAMLRGTRRFSGSPMASHMVLPGLTAELFERWLLLFRQTTAESPNPRLKAEADDMATRVAGNFWQRYQQGHGLGPGSSNLPPVLKS